MGRRSRTRSLGLWMNGSFVGTWRIQPHMGEELQYDANWVSSKQGRPLSLSLPFTPGNEPHRNDTVRTYFENLLPDSKDIRERIARRFQTRSIDAFTLLTEIGRDCVGALQILPEGITPTNVETIQATTMTEAEVAQLLRGVITPTQMGGPEFDNDDFRISIAGAQEKTALLWFNNQWNRPHGTTPSSHILKLPLGLVGNMQFDLSESVENEWLCSEILAAYGLPVAQTKPLQFEEMKVLAVERFDRRWWKNDSGTPWLVRLPQEDMCQATGTPPHLKYEADGGPGVSRIMSLLETSIQAEQDRRMFFAAQVLFWMLCATDGHAKNFSLFIQPGGVYKLTPLYDVISAYPVLGEGPGKLSPFRAKMAMAVRSKNPHWITRDIRRRHWVAVGERYGIMTADGHDVHHILDDLVSRTPEVVHTVRTKLPPNFPETLADSILNGLQSMADRLAD
ncbi:hypothetical protein GCM10011450_09290 [Advenella faeciporci]|uniref:Toxin HipA n=1 Tax=Advenella faeciporci TaxID=797535 RepID=A0A918JKD1_9BURK|nr:type II toxin-antitoxin system HipA family toxin [Advenella faeciporci]GGW81550.1 hypothetical protein GCM10011450_09290 [Advenella faeciporci]